MSEVDPSLRRKFRKTVEGKLETAALHNPGLIKSWDLSRSFAMVKVFCPVASIEENVLHHLATSLTRQLGVGKSLGLVERNLERFTMECCDVETGDTIFARIYPVD